MRTREKSDCVCAYSGKLMQASNVELWQSQATRGFLSPVIVYYECLLPARSREGGEVLLLSESIGQVEHEQTSVAVCLRRRRSPWNASSKD